MIRKRASKSATPATVRQVNIAEVLQALWQQESLSRAELTSILGLSATTMAKLMDSLVQDRIIVETAGSEVLSKGRPSKYYTLNKKQIGIIITLIGINHIRIFACTPDGKTLLPDDVVFDTPDNYSELIFKIKQSTKKIAGVFRSDATVTLGVSLPGMIRENEHYVQLSPNLKFLNSKTPTLDICENTNFIPTTIQEERALCLAQRNDPLYSNLKDIVAIDLSEGFGLGIISNNQLLSGSEGFAGELGHVALIDDGPLCACGKRGCFEVLASDTALVKAASKVMDRELSFDEVASYINASDPTVLRVLRQVISHIAKAIAIAVNIFNPQAVLLNAKMLDMTSYNVLEEIKKHVGKDALGELTTRCIIAQAPIRRRYGVAHCASEKLFQTIIDRTNRK